MYCNYIVKFLNLISGLNMIQKCHKSVVYDILIDSNRNYSFIFIKN